MARQTGSNNFAGTLEVLAGGPLDARSVVKTKADLTAAASFPYPYVGMQVFVESELKRYTLVAADFTDLNNWREDGSGGASTNVYQFGGSILFANLPTADVEHLNFVYDIQDAFTTTSSFVEGAGHDYPAGTNVAIINAGTESVPVYKYDVFTGLLTGYQKKMQYGTLPVPSVDNLGEIYQFTGISTVDYTNGHFYRVIEDPDTSGTYIYEEVRTQEGGAGSLGMDITSAIAVGGIDAGTAYLTGTSYDTLWNDLLNPTLYPTITAPSASITGSGDKLLEVGATQNVTITIGFNRGSINPAYGTSGYRAGEATGYSLNGGASQGTNSFSEVVSGTNKTFSGTVDYAAGEQPKDSKGNDYGTALAAGSVNTSSLNYDFVNAIWGNVASASTIAKLSLTSKSAKVKQFNYPATTAANPEVFDVPASWTVTTVEVLNSLSNQWETATSQFTVTDTSHNDAGGTSTAYKRYTCNLGYDLGARSVRVKWS